MITFNIVKSTIDFDLIECISGVSLDDLISQYKNDSYHKYRFIALAKPCMYHLECKMGDKTIFKEVHMYICSDNYDIINAFKEVNEYLPF